MSTDVIYSNGQPGSSSDMPIEPFRPEYQRVAEDLQRKIRSGELTPGTKLPSKRELAIEYGVGPTSIDTAMIVLRGSGLVRGHPGRGVYVADPLPPDPSIGLAGSTDGN